MGRIAIDERALRQLRQGFSGRRDLAIQLKISVAELDDALAPHVADGTVVQEHSRACSGGTAGREMVIYRLAAQEVHVSARVQRACLRCRQTFMSAGPHNRICSPCKQSSDWHNSAGSADTDHVVRYR